MATTSTETASTSQPGFISGLSNVFGGLTDAGESLLGLFGKWSDIQAKEDTAEAIRKQQELEQNLAISTANQQAIAQDNTQKLLMYGVIGVVGIGSLYVLFRVLK